MDYLSAHTVESFWDELEKMAYAYNDDQEDDRRAAKSRREAGALVGAGALGVAGAGGYAYNKQQKAMAREVAEEMAARSIKGRTGVAAAGLGAFAMGAFGKGLADAAGGSVERAGRAAWKAPGTALGTRKARILNEARLRGRSKARAGMAGRAGAAQTRQATSRGRLKWWDATQGDLGAKRDQVTKRKKRDQVSNLLSSKRGRDARAAGRAKVRRARLEAQAKLIRERRNTPPAGHTPRYRRTKRRR
jgi:hypothetical protein